jgi:pre-mRNA-splicing factor CDC5/CEF1
MAQRRFPRSLTWLTIVQGKKAKRKARERQLDLSKRLALLQKRRELKMSGINIKIKTTKKGEMDYNADIPFERAAAPGFHDTTEEIERNERQRETFDPRKQQLAIKRKGDPQDNEEASRKKRKDDKDDRQSLSAAAIKAAQMQKIREAEQSSKRRALVLPAPEVGDPELEDIVKLGLSGRGAIEAAAASDTPATRGLISDYSRMTGATPLRTPLRTPGPMSTPFRQSLQVRHASAVGGYEPESHINKKLTTLPAPRETEWELELPEEQEEVMDVDSRPEDAEVRDARLKAMREAAEKEEFERQTQVVQRRLPRPVVVDVNALIKGAKSIIDPIRKAVAEESALLIANDAINFGGAKVTGTVKPLPFIEPADIEKAHQMVALELSSDESRQEQETIANALDELHSKSRLPGLDEYDDEIDEHQLMVEEFDNVQEKIMKAAEKGNELEKKLAKYQGGYLARSKLLRQKISEAADALEKVSMEVDTAKSAQIAEQAAADRRLQKLLDDVAFVKKREREAQDAYRAAKQELDTLEMVNGRH